jgi:tetratricopeptide (TPR) repeat protein
MTGDDVVEGCLAKGLELFAAGEVKQALERFRQAHEVDPANARVRSYYGLCLGMVERNFEESAELCRSAARQEFFNPSLYLNLGRLHLTFGFKNEGLRYLQRGQMIDPGNVEIETEIAELGRRDPPIIHFLPRRHIVNRWLGIARHHIAQRQAHRSPA